jgi:hypothetical protein
MSHLENVRPTRKMGQGQAATLDVRYTNPVAVHSHHGSWWFTDDIKFNTQTKPCGASQYEYQQTHHRTNQLGRNALSGETRTV